LAGLLGRPTDDDDITIADDRRIAIVAVLVNPESNENQPGSADERPEMVYLLNRTTQAISLHGWSLLNKHDEAHRITSDIRLDRGEVRTVTMGQIPLSNQGGLITLLDENGNKVDGVSYTKEQVGKKGEVIIFR